MLRRLARPPVAPAAEDLPCDDARPNPALAPAILAPLPRSEEVIYRALVEAAERGERCPLNIDLEMLAGYNSCSMGAAVLRRLERRGLIVVRRFQRFREVQITANGQWTTRPESQRSQIAHVPKGMGRARLEAQAGHLGASRSPAPTERKLYRSGVAL
ncbi:hypothetical protein GRI97_10805 [Altererythrobacter xixiisoli]|uniref:Uncharacterized protein n=1 Tax=Croceibacterium xixiisoli TaxID=1476466 RepID=A0A6I4TXC9_9SPHN|nr:hypothetical protein [Croceibacterium xixiisoli]MXO99477.1 hypothetical protein [Croceibacterium xixiisoli]